MLETLIKLPRTEKFSIGNEYKCSMYKLLEYILYVSKIEKEQRLEYINKIDAELNCQRIYLRIMYKNKWINDKKFNVAITKIGEIREEKLTSKEAKKYLAGHLGYLKIANVNNLTKNIFYLEDE